MIQYIYDKNGKCQVIKVFLGKEGIKLWNKVWKEAFENQNHGKVFQVRNRRKS